MAELKAILYKVHKLKSGEYPVYVVTVVKGSPVRFRTGVVAAESLWDAEKQMIKGNTRDVKDKNLIIGNCKARVNNVFVKYRLKHETLTPDLLRKEYINPSLDIDFYAFWEAEMNAAKVDRQLATTEAHQVILAKLKKYKPVLSFSELDAQFFEGFQRFLKGKPYNNNLNTVRKNLKTIKVYTNLAMRHKILERDPFTDVRIKRAEAEIIYLEPVELAKLIDVYKKKLLPAKLQHVLRWYLFSCFTGLRISDMKSITHENIVAETLVYKPVKTKNLQKIVRVKLTNPAMELVADGGKTTGVIFVTYSDQVINRYLKDIADLCGINKPIRFHSARHTFATMYYRMTKNIIGLQKLLGHADIKQTMVYTHVVQTDIDKEMEAFNGLW